MLLAAEREANNTIVTETLVRGKEGVSLLVHSICLYLQAGDVDDQVNVSVAFPMGGYTPIAFANAENITHTKTVNAYPELLLPDGAGLHVVLVVTGAAKWAGAYVTYEEVRLQERDLAVAEPVALNLHPAWQGIKGVPYV